MLPHVRQLFERFRAPSAAGDADARFAHFRRLVSSRMQEASTSGASSYEAMYVMCVYLVRAQLGPHPSCNVEVDDRASGAGPRTLYLKVLHVGVCVACNAAYFAGFVLKVSCLQSSLRVK